MYGPKTGHLPRRPRVALQEVLVGFKRGEGAELMQSASTFSTGGNLRVPLEELVDLP